MVGQGDRKRVTNILELFLDLGMGRYITLLLFIGLAWGQDCTADDGTDGVELWGECYSIENTDSLNLEGKIGRAHV